jgi:hypothetical protein
MNQPNGQQGNQQAALFKGKSPRNALIAAGVMAAFGPAPAKTVHEVTLKL